MNSGVVYIVHHVDTEGPMCEPVSEVFTRLENILGVKLNLTPNKTNLLKLQNGEIEFEGNVSEEIKKIIDPHLIAFKEGWKDIDEMLYRILSKQFRNKFVDSFGNGWIYNWHVMDHVGFITNERRRDMGYLNIFNHYEQIIKETSSYTDDIQWHFHPVPFFKEAHICATSYENSYYELNQILSRRLIDKFWFPQVNRAGFHTIRPDSNWFLEQWIPFDASNQSVENYDYNLQLDAINGRFGDWVGAPSDWSIYNPDLYDWRKRGNLNRYISRVLNLKTRFRNISEQEIENAFSSACNGGHVYLGITNHDFREMAIEIEGFHKILSKVAHKFPHVKFCYSSAIDAFRTVIGFNNDEINTNCIDFDLQIENNILKIKITNGEPFGPQPYLAFKTKLNQYFHDNLDFGEFKKEYFYTFDRQTINLSEIKTIAVASNDKFGNSKIVIAEFDENGKVQISKH
jgi:hypothetical protein